MTADSKPNRESTFTKLTGKDRALNSISGVIPTAIGLPFALRTWAPTWFVLAWVALYLCNSAYFLKRVLTSPASRVEEAWSTSTGVLFCFIPISAAVWSDRPEDVWAATTIAVIFIAFEMSSLPFLQIDEWRIGIALVTVATSLSAMTTVHPVAALVLIPLVAAMVHAADRVRALKRQLTQQLQAAEHTLRHDPLTGLLNRRGLGTALEGLDDEEISLALIDVDRFKMINDTHGHQVGDQVLIALAVELQSRFSDDFHLARLGGDEFVAVAPGHVEIQDHFAEPIWVPIRLHKQDSTIACSLSIGVSYGQNTEAAQRLLSEAGFAMREAKRLDGTVSLFDTELSDRLDRTVQVAAIASGAHGEFVPLAQTVVSDGKIVGCELLIRWRRPNGELLLPNQFLPLAVEAGMMSTINNDMLEHAVRFAARFNNRPAAPFISVNISAPHLSETGFVERVAALLTDHRVPPERLMIEITETERLATYSGWDAAAASLRGLGVHLAIDDFGTGYSSIERLQHVPISHLKFDRSLVQTVSGPFGEIVGGVVRFAQKMNIGIIAEGIETLDEHESMRAFGISVFQGFLFHRPETLDQVEVRVIEENAQVARNTIV